VIIAIGEILFDIFPGYRRLGGAPFNFAYHLKKLGLPVRFITRVGRDPEGREILKTLHAAGFNMDDVQIDADHPTGTVQVELNKKGVPHFDISTDAAYDHIALNDSMVAVLKDDVDLIYFGTLVQRTDFGFRTLQHLLSEKNPHSEGLYDVNLRPNGYNKNAVLNSLARTDILKLNQEELALIREMLTATDTPADFIRHLMDTYHLKTVSLTKGEAGSELFIQAGHFTAPAKKPKKIIDTVGAGDAYTAVLALGHLRMWKPERILNAAADFSARICGIEGAIPEDDAFYTQWLKKEF
jgi:fructokinase